MSNYIAPYFAEGTVLLFPPYYLNILSSFEHKRAYLVHRDETIQYSSRVNKIYILFSIFNFIHNEK